MDSFSVFLSGSPKDQDISAVLRTTGATLSILAPGDMVASRGAATVWVYRYSVEDLPSRQEWPLPKDDIALILYITVARDDDWSNLAIEMANRLSTEFGAVISWDGHEH